MCGRYVLNMTEAEIVDRFGPLEWIRDVRIAPRFNVAPTQLMPVVVAVGGGTRQGRVMRWGFIPPWARDFKVAPINARVETVAENRMFRPALGSRRCLVPATGFYEWAGAGKTRRPRLFVMADGSGFGFAGLWSAWTGPAGEVVESYTILTTEPNALVAAVHDRMPAILPRAAYDAWLGGGKQPLEEVVKLIGPYPAAEMRAIAVSPRVNAVGNDDPSLVEPIGAQAPLDLGG